MATSARFLSTVAFAFVAGVTTTGVYMSRGGTHREAAAGLHDAATPSLAQRLRAEAHGESLPWSDPVKATLEPPKLTFTPGPTDAPAEEGGAVADQGRDPASKARPVSAPVRLALSDGHTPHPKQDQADPAPDIKRARPSEENVGPSRAKSVQAPGLIRTSRDNGTRPYQARYSSRTASRPDGEAVPSRALSAEAPRHVAPPVEEERTKVRDVDALRRIQPSESHDHPRTKLTEARPRVRLPEADEERLRRSGAEAPRHFRAPDPADDGYPRVRAAEEQRPAHQSRPLPSRNLPSLAAADDIRAAVRRAEARRERVTVAPPYRTAGLESHDDTPSVREVYVVRRDDEPDEEPRVGVHRSVAASDGLMRWLSGPAGRF